jgi:hypothetical protein
MARSARKRQPEYDSRNRQPPLTRLGHTVKALEQRGASERERGSDAERDQHSQRDSECASMMIFANSDSKQRETERCD